MTLTRSEILNNRKIVVEFLKNPEIKKAQNYLADISGARCCLGHMCVALGLSGITSGSTIDGSEPNGSNLLLKFENEDTALPVSIQDKLGMHDHLGSLAIVTDDNEEYILPKQITQFFEVDKKLVGNQNLDFLEDLSDWNDSTNILPQEIGNYLESVIEGGDSTPWKALTSYQEA